MTTTKTPTESVERLAALRSTGLLDSPDESAFDRLTALVSTALRVPVALISLVDKDRQFFKSQCGLPEQWAAARQTPLSHSFCQHVVNTAAPLIVADAREHVVVKDNLAIPELGVIAYAGVPLRDADGYVLGSLCAIDTKPRAWSEADVDLLQALARQVEMEIALRERTLQLARDLEQMRALDASRQAMTRLNVHDLRTPLSALLMGVDLLPRIGPLNEQQKAGLAICKRSGNVLLDLIDNLLDIGAIEQQGGQALRQSECRPHEAVSKALEQVILLAGEKAIDVETDYAPVPLVFADVDKLVRVIVNLLGNAIKFTHPGGRIAIRTVETRDGTTPFVQFSVKDTGIGMADGERIFDEGVVLDRHAVTRRSTGLGLTFCKRIVQAHGGRIWFESELGVGSTFHFTIPMIRA